MKTLEDLRKDIESTKSLINNSDTNNIIKDIKSSRIVYREDDNYWLIDFKINNTIVIYVFQDGRVIVSYDYISSDYIEDSMRLYDFIDSLKKEIKDIFFDNLKDKKDDLISDLLDLTGYKFVISSYSKGDVIVVSDNYFDFIYRVKGNTFTMDSKLSTFIIFDDIEYSYNLFKRLDTYKETYKYIKELLENYIKEL